MENFEQPDWAVSWEQEDDGRTVFRDGDGEPLAALAVNRDELRLLERALAAFPSEDGTAALLYRLATVHLNLDASKDE